MSMEIWLIVNSTSSLPYIDHLIENDYHLYYYKNQSEMRIELMSNIRLTSSYTNIEYDIEVYVPEIKPPSNGFPIYYVLDGLYYFSFVRDVVRIQQLNQIKTGVGSAIVIGICHGKEEMREQRFIDFTAPADKLIIPEHAKGKLPKGYGGAEQFFKFIELELKPYVEKRYPVNLNRQNLFGHSLGGYFALWCLFTYPASFHNYIVISPSVWWNDEELLNKGRLFIENGANNRKNHVFIAVGEYEGFMVDGAKKIGALLQENQLHTDIYIAPDENHASVVPTVISRAVRFCSKIQK